MIILSGLVTKLEPEIQQTWISGSGADTKFTNSQVGWRLSIGNMSFVVGREKKPDFEVGQSVSIIIAKD